MEIVIHSAGSNDRTSQREIHFRPDRSDLRTGGREKKMRRKIESLFGTLERRSLLLNNNMTSEERFVQYLVASSGRFMIAKRTYLDRVCCRGFKITAGVCGVVISSYEVFRKRERMSFICHATIKSTKEPAYYFLLILN